MGTISDRVKQNMAMLYQFKETEFNNILSYLIEQETLSPGVATALAQDFQRRQSSLKDRRNTLGRLRQTGLEGNQQLLVEIEKLKGTIGVARARNITEVSVAKSALEEAFQKDLTGAGTEATQAYIAATGTTAAIKSAQIAVVGNAPDYTKAITVSAAKHFDTVHKSALAKLGTDSVAAAHYKESLEKDLRSAITTRASQAGETVNVDDIINDIFTQKGIDSIKAPADARTDAEAAFEEVKNTITAGGISQPSESRLIALGLTKQEGEDIFGRKTTDPRFESAAYYARFLPQFQDEYLTDPEETKADFVNRLAAGDEKANALYDHVLGQEAADIILLADGQYPFELYQISKAEAKLVSDRATAGDLSGRSAQRDYEEIYNEARQIYSNLFKRQSSPGARKMAERRLQADPKMREVVALVGKEDSSNFQDAITSTTARTIADAHRNDMVNLSQDGESLVTPDNVPITTFEMLYQASGGESIAGGREAMERFVKALEAQPKNVNRQAAILSNYARALSTSTPTQREAMAQDFAEQNAPPVEGEPQASVAPLSTTEQLIAAEETGRQTSPRAYARASNLPLAAGATRIAAATAGELGGAAINDIVTVGELNKRGGTTNDQGKAMRKDAFDQFVVGSNIKGLSSGQRKLLDEVIATGAGLTDQSRDAILGNHSNDPQALLALNAYINALSVA